MAEIARIGTTCFGTQFGVRTVDAMAPHGGGKRIARVRHVAVVALAAARVGGMMGMLFNTISKRIMALEAGFVGLHPRRQLIIGIAVVHRMAGETGQLAS